MKQAKPLRRRRKGPDALLTAKLDTAWSLLVRANTPWCEHCGRRDGKLDAHHHVGRTNRRLRWDLRNGVTLCFFCHRTWIEEDPEGYVDWFRSYRPNDSDYLRRVQNEITHHTIADKAAMLKELQSSLAMGQAA